MLKLYTICVCIAALCCTAPLCAQQKASADSIAEALQQIPGKYINTIDKKITTYTSRISNKTEKTLKKLVKWEEKIKKILEKSKPDLAAQLFGNNRLTFSKMLSQYENREVQIKQFHTKYDYYNDKVSINLKYLDSSNLHVDGKLKKLLNSTRKQFDSLTKETANIEALQELVKERKKQLIEATFRALGKNKYLNKINKEVWYYAETMRNYKAIFNEPEKAEKMLKDALSRVPAFQNFARQNSQLASIFGVGSLSQPLASVDNQSIMGLQAGAGVQNAIRTSLGANTNIRQLVQQNVQQAQAEINRLQNELIKKGGTGSELSMPDFKPNMQKTKTFWQRIEYSTDIQFAKNNSLLPTTSDIALTVGYKLDDKKTIGIGASYKLGLGTIDHIKFTNQGIGFRSYLDCKMKMQIFISGGFEMNYNPAFKSYASLKDTPAWQKSALLGITKKIKIKTKWFKSTKLQLLYDFLNRQHTPVSQPILFRVGYNF